MAKTKDKFLPAYENTLACPYCGVVFDTPLERHRKCPECAKPVKVLKNRDLDARVYLREDDVEGFKAYQKRRSRERRWLKSLKGQYNLTDKRINQERNQLRKKFGQDPNDSDLIWSLMNSLGMEGGKRQDRSGVKQLLFLKARYLAEEGRKYHHLLAEAHKMELQGLKRSGLVEEVEINAVNRLGGACESCLKQHGRKWTLDQALKEMPLPCKDCETQLNDNELAGWCRCMYSPVFDFDQTGGSAKRSATSNTKKKGCCAGIFGGAFMMLTMIGAAVLMVL